jgi:hypothetical protein
VDTQPDPIAATQLAIDGEVEQREFPGSMIRLQSNPDGPGFFQLQWWLLSERYAAVPRCGMSFGPCRGIHEWRLCWGKEPHVDVDLDRPAQVDPVPLIRAYRKILWFLSSTQRLKKVAPLLRRARNQSPPPRRCRISPSSQSCQFDGPPPPVAMYRCNRGTFGAVHYLHNLSVTHQLGHPNEALPDRRPTGSPLRDYAPTVAW